jgi:hypothetical protein
VARRISTVRLDNGAGARPDHPAPAEFATAAANGTSLGVQSPTEIIMIDSSGLQKDAASSIASSGAFSNTRIRSS